MDRSLFVRFTATGLLTLPFGAVAQSAVIRTAADRIPLSALSFLVASFDDLERAFAAMVAKRSTLSSFFGGRRSAPHIRWLTRSSRSPPGLACQRSTGLAIS